MTMAYVSAPVCTGAEFLGIKCVKTLNCLLNFDENLKKRFATVVEL